MFLEKGVLKICTKFTGEHPCRSVISTKLLCNFNKITLRHGCPPVNLLHIFRTPYTKTISGKLLLFINYHYWLQCSAAIVISLYFPIKLFKVIPAGIYLLKVNNRNTRTKVYYMLTYFTPLWHISHLCFSVSIVNFEHEIAGWDSLGWTIDLLNFFKSFYLTNERFDEKSFALQNILVTRLFLAIVKLFT